MGSQTTAEPMTAPVQGDRRAPVSVETRLEEQRNALVQQDAILDLATMSEDDFNRALDRAGIARKRVERILESVLVPGAHFGNPENDGRKAFKHPVLYLAGAEALITMFRLQVYEVMEKQRETVIVDPTLDAAGNIADPGFVSVTVCYGIAMGNGTIGGTTIANCNSREKRFRKFSGKEKWTYEDARETLHDCISIAIKRAVVRLVRGALGLTPWLATEEEMDAAAEREKKKLLADPWTKEDKTRVYAEARKYGIQTTEQFFKLRDHVLGRGEIGTGDDVARLLIAIPTWDVATGAPKATPLDENADDDELSDREIAAQDERNERAARTSTQR